MSCRGGGDGAGGGGVMAAGGMWVVLGGGGVGWVGWRLKASSGAAELVAMARSTAVRHGGRLCLGWVLPVRGASLGPGGRR